VLGYAVVIELMRIQDDDLPRHEGVYAGMT
jgi:hypothetical protein